MDKLVLVVNPGSSSRKYAFYRQGQCVVDLHFEQENSKIVCTIVHSKATETAVIHLKNIADVAEHLLKILSFYKIDISKSDIAKIAIRVVAPTAYFQKHRRLDKKALHTLKELEASSHLHIAATLTEIHNLQKLLANVPIVGISDSAFHSTIPDYISNYPVNTDLAIKHGIKRFGYHGISVKSVVNQLHDQNTLAERVVVCHLGSGSSVTAVKKGKSLDTTMGYSPLEGLMMATRSGSVDPTAVFAIHDALGLTNEQTKDYLTTESGLLGVSGLSADLRQILNARRQGNDKAILAINMYVHLIQQAVARMAASMGGLDCLVFTGTVGERSRELRSLILPKLMFLGLHLSAKRNHAVCGTSKPVRISDHDPIDIFVVPSREDHEIAILAESVN